jgi:hypothetical protein
MNDADTSACPPRSPWNKGKITGPKPPLRPGHVWAIRAKLHLEKRTRDLAMLNLAIDSNCVAVTSSRYGSRMWRRMATPSTEPMFGRGRLVGQFASN